VVAEPTERELFSGEEIRGKEVSDDYLGLLAWESEQVAVVKRRMSSSLSHPSWTTPILFDSASFPWSLRTRSHSRTLQHHR
jgi:hypothetical protein